MGNVKKKKRQAKVFFDKNYDRFTIHDVYEFALKRQEYEDNHPEQRIITKYNTVND